MINFLSIAKMSPWINWLWSKEWINNTYFLINICKVRRQCTFFYINIYLPVYTFTLRFSGIYLFELLWRGLCISKTTVHRRKMILDSKFLFIRQTSFLLTSQCIWSITKRGNPYIQTSSVWNYREFWLSREKKSFKIIVSVTKPSIINNVGS